MVLKQNERDQIGLKTNAIKLEGMNLQINNNQEKYKTQK